ncbi:MAG: UvrD-helicase domain-containing protein [Muribaculaceae bacterium]|nr:UvrD-helicase domain-containing protein [Muribaculaceae bacterium]
MLSLHSASAGSGKTYALARHYLRHFLTITDDDGKVRLRNSAELADSARHILAVTFTNKATNEMQMRIVAALDALGSSAPVYATRADGSTYIKSPAYMQEFVEELHEGPGKIALTARTGLAVLLERYSDFKVSTIDSFFQLVLRTFAYESDLNDGYQVELDNEYVSQLSVDGTLDEIDHPTLNDKGKPVFRSDIRFWIDHLMKSAGNTGWDIFDKSLDTSSYNSVSAYTRFVKSIEKLDNEAYKEIRTEVEDYFNSPHDLREIFEYYEREFSEKEKMLGDAVYKSGADLLALLPAEWYTPSRVKCGNKDLNTLVTQWRRAARRDFYNLVPDNYDPSLLHKDAKVEKAVAAVVNPDELDALAEDFNSKAAAFQDFINDPERLTWQLYRTNLPYLALLEIVKAKRSEYLAESNAIELGETSHILSQIIDDSDTPFVYERLGTTLEHFLIDEFQDTSKMQWRNLKPLLTNSVGYGHGSLIIGDAKQSIYRFRNAEPSLITTIVPNDKAFSGRIGLLGNDPSENTNWRSRRRIVQFNNTLFEYLATELHNTAKSLNREQNVAFDHIYSNVVQSLPPRSPEDITQEIESGNAGYIEARFSPLPGTAGVAPLVDSLCRRGYRQNEIMVLVLSNQEGKDVIRNFVDWNRETMRLRAENADDADHRTEIRFVSEQSLLVANSMSVQLITGVLENIARGLDVKVNDPDAPADDSDTEDTAKKHSGKVGAWNEISTDFLFYAMPRQDKSIAELLDEFIDVKPGSAKVVAMLNSMQSLALPSIVEAVVAEFLSEDLRRRDAIYIAAFQDLVLEYSESHPTDIRSFLDWWSRRSRTAAIASPEGTDAVQVMTVHKAKGLECSCVIVPSTNWDFTDKVTAFKREWRWVKPQMPGKFAEAMPPYMPVFTDSAMMGTPHEPLLNQYFDDVKMDRLNNAYVALTRASQELYLFCKMPAHKKTDGGYLTFADYLAGFDDYIENSGIASDDPLRLHLDMLDISEPCPDSGEFTISIGTPAPDPASLRKPDSAREVSIPLREYKSFMPTAEKLKFQLDDLPAVVEVASEEEGEELIEDIPDLDPRSEGNLKHAVLQHVRVDSDLREGVRRVALDGWLDSKTAEKIYSELAEALAGVKDYGWFGSGLRVINERPLLSKNMKNLRPDRIMIFPDGHAEVVDYKFGAYNEENHRRHSRQLGRYVRLLRATGSYPEVRGFLWYVNEGKISGV